MRMSFTSGEASTIARRGGRAPKHVIKFTITDLIDATGRSHETLRKDRQRGRLDTKDLVSVAQYVVRHSTPTA